MPSAAFCWFPELWQQGDPVLFGSSGYSAQHIIEPFSRIDLMKFTGSHKAIDDRIPLPAPVRAGEQMVVSAESQGSDLSFQAIVVRQQHTVRCVM